ncbi:alpha/beta hydrolase [Leifsonia sp. A12D58]|uniref:alpha/beta hydrolase n=1 Tax=Leifsonia sp. A12D58 TaxID=3397674 RepID=UPI0039E0316B
MTDTSHTANPAAVPSLTDADLTFRAASTSASTSVSIPAPLLLVLPGGSYRMHADHEGTAIADWLSQIGLNALVVRYPVDPNRYPSGLKRVQDVLIAARTGALDLGIDRTRIGVVGFSAGGHVAALLSAGVASAPVSAEGRVDLSILAYPVISMAHEPHSQSLANLLGDDDTLDNRRALSAEYLVGAQTPPTFLWHTADDGGVPVSHSLRYASALAAHNIPFDLHVFERGDHGKGLASGHGPLEAWSALCEAWLAEHGWVSVPE